MTGRRRPPNAAPIIHHERRPLGTQPPPRPTIRHGGVVHSYQKYDPARCPSPTQPPPDMAGMGMEHLLAYGGRRELTDEGLAARNRLVIETVRDRGIPLAGVIGGGYDQNADGDHTRLADRHMTLHREAAKYLASQSVTTRH